MLADSLHDATPTTPTTNTTPPSTSNSTSNTPSHQSDADAPTGVGHIARFRYAAAWLGHATVLLRQAGLTLLVDPVLTNRIGPRIRQRTIGPTRLAPCPVAIADLPAIDLVLLTHAHFDHLDKPTLEALANPGTTVITAKRTHKLIPPGFAEVIELSQSDEMCAGDLRISAIQPAHWGSRSALDFSRGCNSYLLKSPEARTLLPGDTAKTDVFENLGQVDLAAFGIGAYEPSEHHHATPEQVWEMFCHIPGKVLLPIHHSTFELSAEHIDEPMARLLAAAADMQYKIAKVQPGQVWLPRPA